MARKSNKKLYVAYGSNLHLDQMRHRCPDAKVYGVRASYHRAKKDCLEVATGVGLRIFNMSHNVKSV